MTTIPHFTSNSRSVARVLVDRSIDPQEDVITLDSGNTDSGNTPTYEFRAGNVVILRTSTGRYVEANDSNADAPTVASVTAAEAADTDWASATITVTFKGGVSETITLATTDITTNLVVTALNGNAVFAANAEADNSGGSVRIRTLKAGAEEYLHVTSSLTTAFGASGLAGIGSDPDVRVLLENVDLQNKDGTAIHGDALAARKGNFDESNLIVGGSAASATDQHYVEAKAVLARRGSVFN